MQIEELFAATFILGMFAGVFVIFLAMRQRSEILQMQHRERMAMIERGHVPTEPAPHSGAGRVPAATSRSMSAGIMVIGFGLALMTIISVAAESPGVGIGIGGAVAILGTSFIVRSLVVKREPPPVPSPAGPPADRDSTPLA
jgi:hypothetical protein